MTHVCASTSVHAGAGPVRGPTRAARVLLALSSFVVLGLAAGAASKTAEPQIRIVPALKQPPQGAGADLVFGPGNKVWGFDGAYGCGGTPPDPVVGVTCGLFSVNLDGSDYRVYEIPASVINRPVPGDPPSAEDLAKYPTWFAEFFYSPRCNCTASPPVPGRPTGNAYNDLTVGSDGNIWFTAMGEGGVWIGRMTPQGALTVYPMSDFLEASGRTDTLTQPRRPSWGAFPIAPAPWDIEAGPDGRIYFSVYDGWAATLKTDGPTDRRRESWIGSFEPRDPLGTLKTWGIPGLGGPLLFGPDQNLWFMTRNKFHSREQDAVIGRISTQTGGITTWKMPPPTDVQLDLLGDTCCVSWTSDYLQFDGQGRLWYSIEFMRGIGRFEPANGSFTFFTEGHGGEGVFGSSVIAIGNDGLIYQAITPTGDVLQIGLDGRVRQRIKNPAPSFSLALRKMPDGTLWMTDHLRANVQKVVGIADLRGKERR